MINTINEAINRKLNSISFTTIIKGTVESLEPLEVRISNKIVIGLSFIEPRSLGIDDSSPSPALPLVVGEEIEMVRYNNGQRFYVLGKAASGGTVNYNDLQNKPILNTNNTTSQSVSSNEIIGGTIKLHKISKTGSYNDLRDKPTKVSEFTNDAGYLTEHQDLSGYAKKEDLHFHNNKSVLDSITQENIDNWNNSTGEVLPIGTMIPFGSVNNIPTNWRICDGSEVSRTDYAELFNVIGTAYGEGDGTTTFNLPNKKGRVSVGLDLEQSEFNTIGKKSGSKYLQKHKHGLGTEGAWYYGVSTANLSGTGTWAYRAYETNEAGEGDSGNLQPYEIDIWIIKVSNMVGNLEETTGTIIDNLTSTSATDALSANMGKELNEKHNWKLYTTTKGTGTTNLPTDYNELYIEISSTSHTDPVLSIYVPKASLTSSNRTFRTGYYFNSSVHGAVASVITLTTYRTADLYISGAVHNSNALNKIYYR